MSALLQKPDLEQRFVVYDADWTLYQRFVEAIGERPIRVTYDRGRLELMTLSFAHERWSSLLGRIVETLTEELDMTLQSGGSTTFSREDLDRGLEADRCYYLENEPAVRDKEEIDLSVDPPPDLGIEIDVTRSSLNRMPIYAALRVPEVWRFDGKTLAFFRLIDGEYRKVARSGHFPFLSPKDLRPFFPKPAELSETEVIKRFRAWIKRHKKKWLE